MITQPRLAVGVFLSIHVRWYALLHLEQQTTGSQEDNQGCLQMQMNVTVSLFSHSAFEQCYMFFLVHAVKALLIYGYTDPVVPQQQKLDKILHVQRKRVYMQRKCDR